ncbi:MAG: hypothetical protein HC836_41015 [Richelia sp. RM2_1_2]|nr:hypothetical protein [Richelia sp. RM2_1_2]
MSGNLNVTGDLTSARYLLGSDLILSPIVGNQSAVQAWWGLQLRGNKQGNLTTAPTAVGNNNDYSVLVVTDNTNKPLQASLAVIGGTSQTSDLQQWRNVGLTKLAHVDIAGNASFQKISGTTIYEGGTALASKYAPIASVNVYGTQFNLAESNGTSSTTSTSPQTKVTLVTGNLPSGTYKIFAKWRGNRNTTSNSMIFDVTLNGSPVGIQTPISVEPKDTTNITTLSVTIYQVLSGVNTILLRYWGENNSSTTTISDASIELIRVL